MFSFFWMVKTRHNFLKLKIHIYFTILKCSEIEKQLDFTLFYQYPYGIPTKLVMGGS